MIILIINVYTPLKCEKTLNLNHCKNLIDVNILKTVHTLDLSGCIKIINVSMLNTCINLIKRFK